MGYFETKCQGIAIDKREKLCNPFNFKYFMELIHQRS